MPDSINYRELAARLADGGVLDYYSMALARCMDRFAPDGCLPDKMYLLAALTAFHSFVGKHSCLNLAERKKLSQIFDKLPDGVDDAELPAISEGESVPFPLVYEMNRLYLHRFADYERRIANSIKKMMDRDEAHGSLVPGVSAGGVVKETGAFKLDEDQKKAIETGVGHRFSVITGGPGTGKTTILCAILAAMKHAKKDLRIAVCAPTGKAQARMMEAIEGELGEHIAEEYRMEADKLVSMHGTIHRLLGWRPGNKFRHNKDNPLDADLIAVDEVSMGDLPLMAKLLDAVPEDAGLILIGDKDQLSSVESGAVFGDICNALKGEPFAAELTKSHRFDVNAPGIGRAKDAINAGDADGTIDAMKDSMEKGDGVVWSKTAGDKLFLELDNALEEKNVAAKEYLSADKVEDALEKFEKFRIVCAERRGPRGVARLNAHIQQKFGVKKYGQGYPILITENKASIGLYNGDVLLCWPESGADGKGGKCKAWIFGSDGKENAGKEDTGKTQGKQSPKAYPISQLPSHEPAFAMTIHKSQGSGFDNVFMILPDDADSPLLTRELVYTGLTRAKKKCHVWAKEEVLRKAVEKRTVRDSGLAGRLAGQGQDR